MKTIEPYEEMIRNTPAFSKIDSKEDLFWLMRCIEGEVVPSANVSIPEGKAFWEQNGSYYLSLSDPTVLLRLRAMRAGKLCSFQCKFHRDLIDFIASYETQK